MPEMIILLIHLLRNTETIIGRNQFNGFERQITKKIYEQVFANKNVFVYTVVVSNKCLKRHQLRNFGTGKRHKFVIYWNIEKFSNT